MSNKIKILILGLTNKSGLAVARNISRSGCEVNGIIFNDVAAKYSKYINQSFFLGNPEQSCSNFIQNLINHLIKNNYTALIPIHDAALEICRSKKELISSYVKIAGLNEDDKYKYAIDKSELLKLGEKFALSIPHGVCVKNYNEYLGIKKDELTFPVVAKPVSSAKIHNDKVVSFSVKICTNEEQLTDFVRENINCTSILIQEFIQGYGIGYNFIAKNGEILNEYIHKRINEYKGVSTLRQSLAPENFHLKDKVRAMIKNTGWNGVGMIEFMVTPDETPILMEFNGRFFGSVELSVKSGINLPVLFLNLFILNKEIEKNIRVKNVTVRFLHDEVLLYTNYLFKLNFKIYFQWLKSLISSLFSRNYFIEDAIFKDPKFTIGMYFFDLKRMYSKIELKLNLKKIKRKPLIREVLKEKKNITFFCFGNICRSPFAKLIAETVTNDYNFSSMGIVNQEDRMSPENAVAAAKIFEIDLSDHLSKSLFSCDSSEIDLFIIMDKKNYLILLNEGISESKIFFLSTEEIIDPYGGTQYEFEKIYQKIKSEIENTFKK